MTSSKDNLSMFDRITTELAHLKRAKKRLSMHGFEFEPRVWTVDEVINGQYVTICIRDYGDGVGWYVSVDDGYLGLFTHGGTSSTIDEAMEYSSMVAQVALYM